MNYPFQITSADEYHKKYQQSIKEPKVFWKDIAQYFKWRKNWDSVLEWDFKTPDIKWFVNAKLNITDNALSRHALHDGERTALIWEPNNPEEAVRKYTYKELLEEVMLFANVLKNLGVKKGDRVAIYLGMIPELPIAMLACAHIGAIHSVIFGGFSARSITDRVHDAEVSVIVTADGAYRGNKTIPLKSTVDAAIATTTFVKKVLVISRTGSKIDMLPNRDVLWEDEKKKVQDAGITFCETEQMDSEDPLFILYTSGSTGKPKGVVHTTAGYMVWTTYTFVNMFQYQPDDVHFCTADIGWITGHSYIVYGPLCAGATVLMFEGIPTWPDAGRLWDIVDKHQVKILYTAPTAIRSLMSYGLEPIKNHSLQSLRVLGTVGEPINEEAWHWYEKNIGKSKCPIVDTWWQTETGGTLITNLPNVTPDIPTFATLPLPGVQPVLVNEKGTIIEGNDVSGNLCMQFPWPGIIRTTWGDHQRCKEAYFSTYENLYFTGDGAYRDIRGNYKITGRVDDVLNVSGHRIGTAEIENAINMHSDVIESAVVGFPHDVKGQGIYAYVICNAVIKDEEAVRSEISRTLVDLIGAIAKPDKIQFVKGLPKTRSGKIMRRILRKIAENDLENIGDTSTLLEPAIVKEIANGRK